MKKLMLLLLIISSLFISCVNDISTDADYIENTEKSYIVFNFGNQIKDEKNADSTEKNINQRSVVSNFTPALFTHISFDGNDSNGNTVHEEADTFSELSGKKIYVDTGSWTFNLSCDYGTEKYSAETTATIEPGPNPISLKLKADTSGSGGAAYNPAEHPGSFNIKVVFPAENIDRVSFKVLRPDETEVYEESKDVTSIAATGGTKNIVFEKDAFNPGVYIIYFSFEKMTLQGDSASDPYETLNPWGDILTVNPGVCSRGTITLPKTDTVYSIKYNLGGGEWAADFDGTVSLYYTRNSGENSETTPVKKIIKLPPAEALARTGYKFLGWYDNPEFTGTTVTQFDVSDLENKQFYAYWQETVIDIWISCDGDDNYDGTKLHPMKTIKEAYTRFQDIKAAKADGSPQNTIHIMTDYTADNTTGLREFSAAQGTSGELKVNIVGAKGGVDGTPVTITANLATDQSLILIADKQLFNISYVNIISTRQLNSTSDYNGYGCFNVIDGGTLKLNNCSIKKYYAKSAILGVEGNCYLNNVTITNNVAVSDPDHPDDIWGAAVNVSTGTLHITGNNQIHDNKTYKNDKTYMPDNSYNLWIGKYEGGTHYFNRLQIEGPITGSSIGISLDQKFKTFAQGYADIVGTTAPSTYFKSDSDYDIEKDDDGEATIKCNLYVSESAVDDNGSGSQVSPLKSISKAAEIISSCGISDLKAKIIVTGTVPANVTLTNSESSGTQLIADSLTIEGSGSGSGLTGESNNAILTISAPTAITLKNLNFKNGKSSSGGGALTYDGGKNVTIDNCTFTDNEAQMYGGALYITSPEIQITNTEFTGNRVTGTTAGYGYGGAVYLHNAAMTIDDTVTFQSNFASSCGGAIYLAGDADLIMNGSKIEANGAFSKGGAVYVDTAASLIINSTSLIKDNAVMGRNTTDDKQGGALYIAKDGEVTMNNGTISGNASWSGGAIYTKGSFNLKEGELKTNQRITAGKSSADLISSSSISCLAAATQIGALPVITSDSSYTSLADRLSMICGYTGNITSTIEIGIDGIVDMEGGSITSTLLQGQDGAGVCMYAKSPDSDGSSGKAYFNMSGGTISGLKISQSGAVYMGSHPAEGSEGYNLYFNMSGGQIISNTCSNGAGGVFVGACGRFNMTGGEISGNITTKSGAAGGVQFDKSVTTEAWKPTMTLGKSDSESKKILIKGNLYNTANSNLQLNSSDVITVVGKLNTASEIGISKELSSDEFTSGFAANNPGVSPSEIFTSDNGYTITTDTDVEGKFAM